MRLLAILLTGALFFAAPITAKAAEQCTTEALDLVCDEGQVLRGINTDGSKICVNANTVDEIDGLKGFKKIVVKVTAKRTFNCINKPSPNAACFLSGGADGCYIAGITGDKTATIEFFDWLNDDGDDDVKDDGGQKLCAKRLSRTYTYGGRGREKTRIAKLPNTCQFHCVE